MKCPFCGTNNQPGDDFCSNCGAYLKAPASGSADATIASSPVSISATSVSGSPAATTTAAAGSAINSGTLTPNTALQNGRYVVEKVLGQGGMGAAALARDTRVSNKRVVIKELVTDTGDLSKRQEDVRNFEREVETLAQLDHPLIPAVTDSFQEGARYFMVQEYAAGENLESYLERTKKAMPEREALQYASQVLDILDYLEQQNPPIVHRDIKPANIIVSSKDKRARLVDFGIARAQANQNARRKQTSALGTPGYAPPEQYQGNADQRSDLYALAATLHHLLTNRDPRDYAPFIYPPVRTLNPQVSPETAQVLERALKINPNERYQNAAAMKHDIDEILAHRFQSSGDRSSYTLSTSSSLAAQAPPPRTLPPQSPQQAATAARGYQTPPPPATMPGGYGQQRQSGMYAVPPAPVQRRKNPVLRNFILLLVVVVLISAVLFVLPRLATTGTGGPGTQPITPAATSVQGGNPISVRQAGNALIGLSDGSYAFDTDRPGGALKKQATEKFQQGDYAGAMSLLRQALAQDTNDAEALIYLENARIMLAHAPYATFVVGTMPSGDKSLVSVGRDNLQGAYVAQKEMNDSGSLPGGMKVRLLIASSGDQKENAASVAQQIAQLAKTDKTFAGVVGWSFSSLTFAAVPVLSQARIPVVSPTASDDGLSGISPYFFRIAPPNKAQAVAGAKYAEETLGSKNAVVFVDPADPYSQSLASAFATQFKNDGRNVLATINYTVGQRDTIASGAQQALQNNPDLIYFAGHASDADALLVALSSQNVPPSLKILGGDALYESNGYSDGGSLRGRLHFTAFAYPDEWDILGMGDKKPAFFSNYAKAFDPDNKHKGLYGYSRPANDTMMSYDAMTALLKAYSSATGSKKGDDLKNALAQLSFQGVSGFIKFDSNGDPVNKAIVIIAVDDRGNNHLEKVLNKFTA